LFDLGAADIVDDGLQGQIEALNVEENVEPERLDEARRGIARGVPGGARLSTRNTAAEKPTATRSKAAIRRLVARCGASLRSWSFNSDGCIFETLSQGLYRSFRFDSR
jgi:hypothetical protein